MKILVSFYSRSGHTETLAHRLQHELQAQGHTVVLEKITCVEETGKWQLVPPLWSAVPLVPLILWLPPFRRWWLRRYPQPELPIAPLGHPDVSGFDCVLVGGPKWLYIAYPLARYLRTVDGLAGKPVGAFATFCGPPLKVFELEMLFTPIAHRLAERGARLVASIVVSSHFHEFQQMVGVFRLISRLRFGRPLRSFTLDSPWGRQEVAGFCAALMGEAAAAGTACKQATADACQR
jgi:hypothetical protein